VDADGGTFAEDGDRCGRKRSLRRELGAKGLELASRWKIAVPEEPGRLLEGCVGREVVDAESGDDELTGLAVDVTEARRCGDDALEAIGDRGVVCHDPNIDLYSQYSQC